ncbi:MAG: redoxin domain-containing protein [Chloroflexi bacterium]|nr:redoxin domain-containing protein [Chloroflexota bacterium]
MCQIPHEHQNHNHDHEHEHHNHEHNHGDEEDYINIPRLGEKASHFNVPTTMGTKTLNDYSNQWLILFSYNADFAPVSASELLDFAKYHGQFKALGTEILAISFDSLNSHIAWVLSLVDKTGVQISFPIATDVDGSLAMEYGMICEEENAHQTARCLYIIDDTQTVRYASYYPSEVGRNAAEVLRVLKALKKFNGSQMAAPAAWQEGDKGLMSPPTTVKEALDANADKNNLDWYFSLRD